MSKITSGRARVAEFLTVTLRNLGPLSWPIIIAISGLYLLPFIRPGVNYEQQLSTYGALGAFPAGVALLLRGRRGIILTITAIQISIIILLFLHFGLALPASISGFWLASTIMGYMFGLFLGQFMHINNKLRTAHLQLAETHQALQEHHDALQEANAELQVMQEELYSNNEALTRANARLEALATVDSLTGLLNHRAFVEALDDELACSRRIARSCALLFLILITSKR
jgi:hypothetical protein